MIDPSDLDVADEVPPFEAPTDAELEQMARYYEHQDRARPRGAALAVLVDELRAPPDGLASRVRADLLLADVLRARCAGPRARSPRPSATGPAPAGGTRKMRAVVRVARGARR